MLRRWDYDPWGGVKGAAGREISPQQKRGARDGMNELPLGKARPLTLEVNKLRLRALKERESKNQMGALALSSPNIWPLCTSVS